MSGTDQSTQMRDEDFNQCLSVLQKSGENFRSTVYAFIVAYGALLLWALNAVVFPVEQDRLGKLQETAIKVVACLPPPSLEVTDVSLFEEKQTDDCKLTLKEMGIVSNFAKPRSTDKAAVLTQTGLASIEIEYLKHRILDQSDRASRVSELTVPFIGVSSDRNWLWLVNIALGVFLLYLIRDALINLERMLRFLFLDGTKSSRENVNPIVRRNLLLMSQVITSGRPRTERSNRSVFGNGFSVKFIVQLVIFSLPIVVSSLVVGDWFWYVYIDQGAVHSEPHAHWLVSEIIFNLLGAIGSHPVRSDFINEPEFLGGIVTFLIMLWEVRLFFAVSGLLLRLSRLHWNIQKEAGPHLST